MKKKRKQSPEALNRLFKHYGLEPSPKNKDELLLRLITYCEYNLDWKDEGSRDKLFSEVLSDYTVFTYRRLIQLKHIANSKRYEPLPSSLFRSLKEQKRYSQTERLFRNLKENKLLTDKAIHVVIVDYFTAKSKKNKKGGINHACRILEGENYKWSKGVKARYGEYTRNQEVERCAKQFKEDIDRQDEPRKIYEELARHHATKKKATQKIKRY